MKKALVLFLILAVAGGVFAGGVGENSAAESDAWSADGFVSLNSTINILNGVNSIGYNGDTEAAANVHYKLNGFQFDLGAVYDGDENLNLNTAGTYNSDNFGFKFGARLRRVGVFGGNGQSTTGTGTVNLPDGANNPGSPDNGTYPIAVTTNLWFGVTDAHGYFKFMDSKLIVRAGWIGGGQELWRTSTIVLRPSSSVANGGEGEPGWENRTSLYIYTDGLGLDGLSIGFRLKSPFAYPAGSLNDYFDGFLFGAKFAKDNLAFSAMFSYGANVSKQTDFYLGVQVKNIADMINLGVDVTAFALSGTPRIYAGMSVGFGIGDLDASVKFRAGRLTQSAMDMDILVNVGYSAFGLSADLNVFDLLDKGVGSFGDNKGGLAIEFAPSFSAQITDALAFGIDVDYIIGLGTGNKNSLHEVEFSPGITWTVYKNATISFGYTLGYDIAASGLSTNEFKLGFKWAF
jgi:hypothetical protein